MVEGGKTSPDEICELVLLDEAPAPPAADDLPLPGGGTSALVLCRRRSSDGWPNNIAESDTLPSSPAAADDAAPAGAVPLDAEVGGGTSPEGRLPEPPTVARPPRVWCRRPVFV